MNGPHDLPAVFQMRRQHRIGSRAGDHLPDILVGRHDAGDGGVAGQPTATDHPPEILLRHQAAGGVGQGVCEPMMLVIGAHEHVGAVQRGADRIVVAERATSGEHVPGIVHVVVGHANPEGEVHTNRLRRRHMLGHELALRIDHMVLGQFLGGIGRVVRIDHAADLADGGIIRGLHQPDAVLVRQLHGRNPLWGISRKAGERGEVSSIPRRSLVPADRAVLCEGTLLGLTPEDA